jgi:H+-transporting ATPase
MFTWCFYCQHRISPAAFLMLTNVFSRRYNANEIRDRVDDVIEQFGSRGFRAIGVGKMDMNTQEWHFLGLIPLFDPPRDDTKSVIEQALAMGVEVKMVTGDHLTIAKETARRLGMGTNIYTTSSLLDGTRSESQLRDLACTADGFAQVFPEHKFKVVELIQQAGQCSKLNTVVLFLFLEINSVQVT